MARQAPQAHHPVAGGAAAGPPPVALVTGGSRGLGRGVALSLAAAGYSVAIGYRSDAAAATATATACQAAAAGGGQRFHPVRADVAVAADRKALLAATLRELGGVDVLVNNAGVAPRQRADLLEAAEESFNEVLATNLVGPYFLTQAVARHWLSRTEAPEHRRAVIFVTSISAAYASVSRGEYCVSKAGLTMARELFAVRLAEAGIGVYEVRPGLMQTDMTAAVKEKYDALIAEGLVPQGRWGTPEDVGRAVAALVSGAFDFSQGTVVDVDGGFRLLRL